MADAKGPTPAGPAVKAIYPALTAICAEMGGLPKDAQNQEQKYRFRSIEAALAKLKPLMDVGHVVPQPKVYDVRHEAIKSARGTPGWRTTLTLRVRWRSAVDGSFADVWTAGEATDYSDKATNKAMTAAWKYAIMLTFACQFEDEGDGDRESPEAGQPARASPGAPGGPPARPKPPVAPEPSRTPAKASRAPAARHGTNGAEPERYSEAAHVAGLAALEQAGYQDREIGYIFEDEVKGGKWQGRRFIDVPLKVAKENVDFWTSAADKPNPKLARKWQAVVTYKEAAKAVAQDEAMAEIAGRGDDFPFGANEGGEA